MAGDARWQEALDVILAEIRGRCTERVAALVDAEHHREWKDA
jgi:hypothetical protein